MNKIMKKICFLLFLFSACIVQAQNSYCTDKDISYVPDSEMDAYRLERCKLDIYYPENAAEKLPVIIDIHGGGLMYAEKEVNRVYASRLAKRGYIVVCINYSLCPDVTYPTQVSDVMASYRWVAENGED